MKRFVAMTQDAESLFPGRAPLQQSSEASSEPGRRGAASVAAEHFKRA